MSEPDNAGSVRLFVPLRERICSKIKLGWSWFVGSRPDTDLVSAKCKRTRSESHLSWVLIAILSGWHWLEIVELSESWKEKHLWENKNRIKSLFFYFGVVWNKSQMASTFPLANGRKGLVWCNRQRSGNTDFRLLERPKSQVVVWTPVWCGDNSMMLHLTRSSVMCSFPRRSTFCTDAKWKGCSPRTMHKNSTRIFHFLFQASTIGHVFVCRYVACI